MFHFLFPVTTLYIITIVHFVDTVSFPSSNHLKTPIKSTLPIPLLIAHRGDKFLAPKHTLAAYSLALREGVDFVEPDLVLTKDGVLVCHHDVTLREDTDVATHPEFEHLRTENKTIILDGVPTQIEDDWLIADFTLDQLKKLRVFQEKIGVRSDVFDWLFSIPTFNEYLETVHDFVEISKSTAANVVGIMPELKHTDYHNHLHNSTPHFMETLFLDTLTKFGYPNSCSYRTNSIPCPSTIIQSFDVPTVMYLSKVTKYPLMTLLEDDPRYLTYGGLKEIRNATRYLGIWKEFLFGPADTIFPSYNKTETEALGGFVPPAKIVEYVHNLGMLIGVWTVYHSAENSTLGCFSAGGCANISKEQELMYFFNMGVDAVFVEGIFESIRVRDKWLAGKAKTTNFDSPSSFGSDFPAGFTSDYFSSTLFSPVRMMQDMMAKMNGLPK